MPTIKIIDTLDFGDTRGIAQDKFIRGQISDTFKNWFTNINNLCFITQSSKAKLTANQRYIFTISLDLFGKDGKENFITMLIFCEWKEPQIVAKRKRFYFW